jgi:hypothetical protein
MTAVLERFGKLAETITDRIVIRRPTPSIQSCAGLDQECVRFEDCCNGLGCFGGFCRVGAP